MRAELTRERLRVLVQEIARTAPRGATYRVFLVGGGTAVLAGWRPSTIVADPFAEDGSVFNDVQGIKERLDVNVEFARPEYFVPALHDSESRHLFIETVDRVSYYHYDPYAQVLSKVVHGFERDLDDARHFVRSGMIDTASFARWSRGSRPPRTRGTRACRSERSCRRSTRSSPTSSEPVPCRGRGREASAWADFAGQRATVKT